MLRTFISSLALVALSAFSVCAQQTKVWKIVDTTHIQYGGTGQEKPIAWSSASDIVLIGDATDSNKFRHVIKQTLDSGKTWRTLNSSQVYGMDWHSIEHPASNLIVVVGDSMNYLGSDQNGNQFNRYRGVILLSRDAGKTWSTTFLDSNTSITGIAMRNEREGAILMAHRGNIYNPAAGLLTSEALITSDGWKTWNVVTLPDGVRAGIKLCTIGDHSYGFLATGDTSYFMYRSDNDGRSWQRLGEASDWPLSMNFLSSTHGLVCGGGWSSHGRVWETLDGGRNWSLIIDTAFPDYYTILVSVASSDTMHAIAAGSWMVSTEDGGKHWQYDFPSSRLKNVGFMLYTVMPRSDFALAAMSSNFIISYTGESTLAAPFFHEHEFGPLPIAPTRVSWTPIVGSTGYHLQLAAMLRTKNTYDSTVFQQPLIDTIVSDTLYVYEQPEPNLYYYARVQAVNSTQQSDWREKVGIFYTVPTATTVLPPTVVSPPSSTTVYDSLVLVWTSVAGARSYTVLLYWEAIALDTEVTVTDTTATFYRLLDRTMYTPMVRANFDGDSASDWSSGAYYINFSRTLGVSSGVLSGGPEAYPNPARSLLHVRSAESGARAYLLDLLGNRVASATTGADGDASIDVHSLPAGDYLLVLEGKRRTVRHISVVH